MSSEIFVLYIIVVLLFLIWATIFKAYDIVLKLPKSSFPNSNKPKQQNNDKQDVKP